MKKRLLSALLVLLLCMNLMPMTVFAASVPDDLTFDISEGSVIVEDGSETGKVKITYGEGQMLDNVDPRQEMTVTGSTTNTGNEVQIKTNTLLRIAIQDLYMDKRTMNIDSGNSGCGTICLNYTDAADVTLVLKGDNKLIAGWDKAGISVPAGARLTIEGEGSLYAKGYDSTGTSYLERPGAGIGGDSSTDCGTIIINSGTIEAVADYYAPGIGGGGMRVAGSVAGGNGGTIIINGGTVTVRGGKYAADIGGGYKSTDPGTLSGSSDAWIDAPNTWLDHTNLNAFLNGVVFGDVVLTRDRTVESLTVPDGTSLTIPAGKTLMVTGTLKITGFAVIEGDLSVAEGGTLEKYDPTQYVPVLDSRTNDSVTIQAVSGTDVQYGYSIDGSEPANWQDSSVFTGLTPSTQYTFFVKVLREDAYYLAGVSTGLQVHTLPHVVEAWSAEGEKNHKGFCTLCQKDQVEAHRFVSHGVQTSATGAAYEQWICSDCGYEKQVYDTSSSLTLKLEDSWGDGWEGAQLLIRRNGQLWQSLTLEDGRMETVYLPYAEGTGYSFWWKSGKHDEEISLTITGANQDDPILDKYNFSNVDLRVPFLQLNTGDYTDVFAAVDEMPTVLSGYTVESAQAYQQSLQKVMDAANWELPGTRQAEIDQLAADIRAATALLKLDTSDETTGRFDLSAAQSDLYITETGWRWGEDGSETAYTGAYLLVGRSNDYRVIVESGDISISIFELYLIRTYKSPFTICSGASVRLTVLGKNELQNTEEDDDTAGLNVPDGAELIITEQSTGSLYAYSDEDGAGIGGNRREKSGSITINGGVITAVSGDDGAGIGGGYRGDSGPITINGGVITAISRDDGAGIGSGYNGTSGPITINGGIVTAQSDEGKAFGAAPDLSGYAAYAWRLSETEPYRQDAFTWKDTDTYTALLPVYTVTFDTVGGSVVQPQDVIYGKTVVIPVNPTKAGYIFDGWHNGDTVYNFDLPVTVPLTLIAQWTRCDHSGSTAKPTCTDSAICTVCGSTIDALGHSLVWRSGNGQYWQECENCDYETVKKAIPMITINGADQVCRTQDYQFSFTLLEDCKNPTYGYDFMGMLGDGGLTPAVTDGVYSGEVTTASYYDAAGFKVIVEAETADGFAIHAEKAVTIVNEHTGGKATCKDKATCEICGEEYGTLDPANHSDLKYFPANAATKKAEGNTEYWYCSGCDKYFGDKDAAKEIKKADTITEKLKDDPKSPQTGDTSHFALWISLLLVSGGVIIGAAAVSKKKKAN